MPLILSQRGQVYKILKITGKDEVKSHLRNLGFKENEQISVIQQVQGNIIVEIKNSRIAMDASLAKRIMV